MVKPFKTIDEQYNLLLSRGLEFTDEHAAKTYLLRNNYYNILNSYGKFFTSITDEFKTNTNFDEITQVHIFDKEVKSILFKYILEAEKHLKSIISYYFSEAHKDQAYPYLIATNYRNTDILKIAPLITNLSNIISKYQNKDFKNSIQHYIKFHGNVPFWVLSNYMSLGQIVVFFKRMNLSEQNKVAKEFSKLLSQNLEIPPLRLEVCELTVILDNLLEVRNIVAHNNRLLDFKCKRNIPYIKELHSQFINSPNDPRQDVYNVFIALRCLLTKNQYAQLHNSNVLELEILIKNLQLFHVMLSYNP
ncbi:MAG: Abi family protein [Longicatena sp.]